LSPRRAQRKDRPPARRRSAGSPALVAAGRPPPPRRPAPPWRKWAPARGPDPRGSARAAAAGRRRSSRTTLSLHGGRRRSARRGRGRGRIPVMFSPPLRLRIAALSAEAREHLGTYLRAVGAEVDDSGEALEASFEEPPAYLEDRVEAWLNLVHRAGGETLST